MARAAGVDGQPVVRLGLHKASSRDVLLCPHAGERFKEWPEPRWSALAEAAIGDPRVPFRSLNVLTNEPAAVPYFQRLTDAYNILGKVKVDPANIPQVKTGVVR
jgi:hypothetical protein